MKEGTGTKFPDSKVLGGKMSSRRSTMSPSRRVTRRGTSLKSHPPRPSIRPTVEGSIAAEHRGKTPKKSVVIDAEKHPSMLDKASHELSKTRRMDRRKTSLFPEAKLSLNYVEALKSVRYLVSGKEKKMMVKVLKEREERKVMEFKSNVFEIDPDFFEKMLRVLRRFLAAERQSVQVERATDGAESQDFMFRLMSGLETEKFMKFPAFEDPAQDQTRKDRKTIVPILPPVPAMSFPGAGPSSPVVDEATKRLKQLVKRGFVSVAQALPYQNFASVWKLPPIQFPKEGVDGSKELRDDLLKKFSLMVRVFSHMFNVKDFVAEAIRQFGLAAAQKEATGMVARCKFCNVPLKVELREKDQYCCENTSRLEILRRRWLDGMAEDTGIAKWEPVAMHKFADEIQKTIWTHEIAKTKKVVEENFGPEWAKRYEESAWKALLQAYEEKAQKKMIAGEKFQMTKGEEHPSEEQKEKGHEKGESEKQKEEAEKLEKELADEKDAAKKKMVQGESPDALNKQLKMKDDDKKWGKGDRSKMEENRRRKGRGSDDEGWGKGGKKGEGKKREREEEEERRRRERDEKAARKGDRKGEGEGIDILGKESKAESKGKAGKEDQDKGKRTPLVIILEDDQDVVRKVKKPKNVNMNQRIKLDQKNFLALKKELQRQLEEWRKAQLGNRPGGDEAKDEFERNIFGDDVAGRKTAKQLAMKLGAEEDMTVEKTELGIPNLGKLFLVQRIVEGDENTIKYRLSEPFFIDIGWTILPETKVTKVLKVFETKPGKEAAVWNRGGRHTAIEKKFYPDGKILGNFNPDGTCSIFYPNKKPAILVTRTTKRIQLSVMTDDPAESVCRTLATFDSLGNGTVHSPEGSIRLTYGQSDGIDFDTHRSHPLAWNWYTGGVTMCYPVIMKINKYTCLHVIDQKWMYLTFYAEKKMIRFELGVIVNRKKLEEKEKFEEPSCGQRIPRSTVQHITNLLRNLTVEVEKLKRRQILKSRNFDGRT